MPHLSRRSSVEVERVLVNRGDFVDADNDYVVTSRLGHLVDRSDAIAFDAVSIGGLRRIAALAEARDSFDSDKDAIGQAGIEILDVLIDSGRW